MFWTFQEQVWNLSLYFGNKVTESQNGWGVPCLLPFSDVPKSKAGFYSYLMYFSPHGLCVCWVKFVMLTMAGGFGPHEWICAHCASSGTGRNTVVFMVPYLTLCWADLWLLGPSVAFESSLGYLCTVLCAVSNAEWFTVSGKQAVATSVGISIPL